MARPEGSGVDGLSPTRKERSIHRATASRKPTLAPIPRGKATLAGDRGRRERTTLELRERRKVMQVPSDRPRIRPASQLEPGDGRRRNRRPADHGIEPPEIAGAERGRARIPRLQPALHVEGTHEKLSEILRAIAEGLPLVEKQAGRQQVV